MKFCHWSSALLSFALAINIPPQTASQTLSWEPTNGPFGGKVAALAVDSTGAILASEEFTGVFRSTDDGQTWKRCSSLDYVAPILVEPSGKVIAVSHYGIELSSDNGCTWKLSSDNIDSTYPTTLSLGPTGSVFAGTYHGVFRSTDGGEHWLKVSAGLTAPDVRAIAILDNGLMFAGTSTGPVFISSDGGDHWSPTPHPAGQNSIFCMLALPGNSVLVSAGGGLFRSDDSGKSWVDLTHVYGGPFNQMYLDSSGSVFAATSGYGIVKSTDRGNSWLPLNQGLTTIYALAVIGSSHSTLIGGTQFRGVWRLENSDSQWLQTGLNTLGIHEILAHGSYLLASVPYGLSRTVDWGTHWRGISPDYAYSFVQLESSPSGSVIGVSETKGIFRSNDTGATWQWLFGGFITEGYAPWVRTIVVHPSGTIVASGDSTYRSLNDGVSWESIPNVPAANAFATGPEGNIYAGSGDGIWVSTDQGAHWDSLGFKGEDVDVITVDHDGRHMYSFVSGRGLMRSSDGGASWRDSYASPGLYYYFGSVVVNAIHQVFYMPFDAGVARSTDYGDSWTDMSLGLPSPYLWTLAIDSSGYLFAGTNEDGVYRTNQSTTGIQQDVHALPSTTLLLQNYPNPFNPSTSIKFELPRTSQVSLTVFDMLGRQVSVLVNEKRDAGVYEVKFDGSGLSSGVYLYRIQAGTFVQTRKLLLLR